MQQTGIERIQKQIWLGGGVNPLGFVQPTKTLYPGKYMQNSQAFWDKNKLFNVNQKTRPSFNWQEKKKNKSINGFCHTSREQNKSIFKNVWKRINTWTLPDS